MNAQEQLYRQTHSRFDRMDRAANLAAGVLAAWSAGLEPGTDLNKPAAANVSLADMKEDLAKPSPGLAKGQLWKTDTAYIQIVELGKRLIHYKLLRQPGQKAVLTRMIGIDALAVYLRASEAALVTQPD
jgi:hypothetical protein